MRLSSVFFLSPGNSCKYSPAGFETRPRIVTHSLRLEAKNGLPPKINAGRELCFWPNIGEWTNYNIRLPKIDPQAISCTDSIHSHHSHLF